MSYESPDLPVLKWQAQASSPTRCCWAVATPAHMAGALPSVLPTDFPSGPSYFFLISNPLWAYEFITFKMKCCQVLSNKQKFHITQASGGSRLSWSKARNVCDRRCTWAHRDLPEQPAGLTAVDLGEAGGLSFC